MAAVTSPRPAVHGVPQWMLSAWPLPDPDCAVCRDEDLTQTAEEAPADRLYAEIQGPPLALGGGAYPSSPKRKGDTRDVSTATALMMPLVATRSQPTLVADCDRRLVPMIADQGPTLMQLEEDARRAFEMFQVLRDRIGYLYAFDIGQAMSAARLDVDEGQEAELMHAFGLRPGDVITFEQFSHMCDLVRNGRVVRTTALPAEEDEPAVPGSPTYQSDPIKAAKKKEPAKEFKPRNYHKWMDTQMGDSGCGVVIPDSVRRAHYTEKVEALENERPVPAAKKPPQPDLTWSPFRDRRNS